MDLLCRCRQGRGSDWKLSATGDHLIVGEQNHLLLSSTGTACIESVTAEEGSDTEQKLEWKSADKHDVVNLDLKLRTNNPGSVRIVVRQYGKAEPDILAIQAFAKPAELKGVEFHLGDKMLTISGSNLSEVRQLEFNGATFAPAEGPDVAGTVVGTEDASANDVSLRLNLTSGSAPKAKAGDSVSSKVTLTDGRTLTLPFSVQGPRPSLTVLSRRVVRSNADTANIQLLNPDDVPLDAQLMLSFRSASTFPRDAQIEIASEDNTLHDRLTLGDGSLVLQDRSTVLGQIDLRKTFGSSAFGPVRVRLVLHDGTAGDWQPLVTLVRLPTISELTCSGTGDLSCTLTGTNLYLISSIAADQSFAKPVDVPDGFVGSTLMVAKPVNGMLYLRLRDDPTSTSSVTISPRP